MEEELYNLSKLLDNPERPFVSVIGGNKVSSKVGIIRSLIKKSDVVLIGGGMAYTFIRAQGGQIGQSIYEKEKLGSALNLIEFAKRKETALILPDDAVCIKVINNKTSAEPTDFRISEIPLSYSGCDIGPISRANFVKIIKEAKSVLWNGPVGIFEDSRFQEGSKQIASALSQMKKAGAFTVVGGGDSVSAIHQFGYLDSDFSHVSTGGGGKLRILIW